MKFNFQKIVIIIAIILLILALAFIGTAISNEKNTHDFPPVIAECPDYWTHDVEQNKCINVHELGRGLDGEKVKELDLKYWKDYLMCLKKWASNLINISWDGISNNPKFDTC